MGWRAGFSRSVFFVLGGRDDRGPRIIESMKAIYEIEKAIGSPIEPFYELLYFMRAVLDQKDCKSLIYEAGAHLSDFSDNMDDL